MIWVNLSQMVAVQVIGVTVNNIQNHNHTRASQLNKFQKSTNKLDRAHPTHPPPMAPSKHIFVSGNPSVTWTEHSNHNNQQLLLYIYRQNTHGTVTLLQNISTGLRLFWDNFPTKQKILSETWLDPPTHFHSNLGFLAFFSLQSPLEYPAMFFCEVSTYRCCFTVHRKSRSISL